MAKVNAPLLSISASGQFAKAIVYASWKGINYAREYFVPSNPQSAAQVVIRGYFSSAVTAWKGATQVIKDAWTKYASDNGLQMSGYNLFVQKYVDFMVGSAGTPPTVINAPPNMT